MFAETLGGIALVKSAVDGIKGAIGTAKDVGEIADFLDQLFVGQQQIQKKKIKKQNDPFSVDSVAREPSTPSWRRSRCTRFNNSSTCVSATSRGSRSSTNAPSGFENTRNKRSSSGSPEKSSRKR